MLITFHPIIKVAVLIYHQVISAVKPQDQQRLWVFNNNNLSYIWNKALIKSNLTIE